MGVVRYFGYVARRTYDESESAGINLETSGVAPRQFILGRNKLMRIINKYMCAFVANEIRCPTDDPPAATSSLESVLDGPTEELRSTIVQLRVPGW